MNFIDITRLVSERTAVWPGDTTFSRQWVMAINDGASVNTSTLTLSAHTGTHTDSPHHIIEGAPGLSEVPLERYIGRCRVIHTKRRECVALEDIEGLDLTREERLLFRTDEHLGDDEWKDDFGYISVEVARRAAEAGLRLIGLDTPSVDPMTSKTLEAHKILIGGNVAIMESANLSRVEEGVYELIALPLRIEGADSSPVRAILRPWTERGA